MDGTGNGHAPRVELVDVSRVSTSGNIRTDLGDLHELAATFDHGAPTQPPVVVENGAGGYDLLVGQRRLAASVLLGQTQVHVLVVPARPANLLLTQAKENLARKALNPLEEARAYAALLASPEVGGHQGKLAELVGVSQATISRRLGLLSLAEPVQELVEDGTLAASHAEEIADAGLDRAQQALVANDLRGRSKITVNVVKHAVRQKHAAPDEPVASAATPAEPEQIVGAGDDEEGPMADCPPDVRKSEFYKHLVENGDEESYVRYFQRLQDARCEVMEIVEEAVFSKMTTDLRRRFNTLAVNIIKDLRRIEEMTR